MRQRISLVVGVLLFVLGAAIVPGAVRAQTSGPADPQSTPGLTERIQQRKTTVNQKPTQLRQNRIKQRCSSVKSLLKDNAAKPQIAIENRSVQYKLIESKLNEVQAAVDPSAAESSQFAAQLTEFSAKIQNFNALAAAHKQALEDAALIDCTNEPTAFHDALEQARTNLTNLRASSIDIRTYLNDTVKPSLTALRQAGDN